MAAVPIFDSIYPYRVSLLHPNIHTLVQEGCTPWALDLYLHGGVARVHAEGLAGLVGLGEQGLVDDGLPGVPQQGDGRVVHHTHDSHRHGHPHGIHTQQRQEAQDGDAEARGAP